MDEFLSAAASFPTVVFTVALLVVIGYWLIAIVGGVGSDLLDGAAGKVEGAVQGKVEGAAEAVAGKLGGAAEAASGKLGGAAEGAAGKVEGGAATATTALSALGFGTLPATAVISSLVLWAWALCLLAALWSQQMAIQGPLVGLGSALAAVFLSGVITGLIARCAGRVIVKHRPVRRAELVGKLCTITTGRVDERFGQAMLHEDGSDLIVDVRCDTPNPLVRHARALLVAYDAEHHLYTVAPYDEALASAPGLKDTPPRR